MLNMAIEFLLKSLSKINLRPAISEDENEILEWRNDPVTISFTPTKNTVALKDHKKWFRKQLISKNSWLLIALSDNNKIGMVRFDYVDYYLQEYFEISINLNPEYRGKKLSNKIINLGIDYIKNTHNKNIPIFAKISDDNTASIKTFNKSNFIKYVRSLNDKYIKDPVAGGWNYYIYTK